MDRIFDINIPRITVFVGEFGSGKTELAVNYAMEWRRRGFKTALADMDILKPYFRSRETADVLAEQGVYLAAPPARFRDSDLPVLPENLSRLVADVECRLVMDAGGGESAKVFGQINDSLQQNDYQVLMVVNICRPFTVDCRAIVETAHRIEAASRLRINGLVSNTNLIEETTLEQIDRGVSICKTAAAQLAVPLVFVVVPEWVKTSSVQGIPAFNLRRFIVYPGENSEKY